MNGEVSMNDQTLKADIADRYMPFLEVLREEHQPKLHSVYIVGSALTRDYDPKKSDINSVIVLLGKDAPHNNQEILSVLAELTGIQTDAFSQVSELRNRQTKPSIEYGAERHPSSVICQ
jgi:predicted nucleotidyltransferase